MIKTNITSAPSIITNVTPTIPFVFRKIKKKSANNQVRLENLKVYESDEKHKGKAKDFFENEDEIHEINVPDDDFLTFNNDVEKIVLHDEREEQIPVSFSKKTSVTKSRRK